MFIHPLHGTLGFIKSYQSVNVKFIEHPHCVLLFRQFFDFMVRAFVLYSHYSYSIFNEKLNGQQTFESMSLSGALTFLFKQHIS